LSSHLTIPNPIPPLLFIFTVKFLILPPFSNSHPHSYSNLYSFFTSPFSFPPRLQMNKDKDPWLLCTTDTHLIMMSANLSIISSYLYNRISHFTLEDGEESVVIRVFFYPSEAEASHGVQSSQERHVRCATRDAAERCVCVCRRGCCCVGLFDSHFVPTNLCRLLVSSSLILSHHISTCCPTPVTCLPRPILFLTTMTHPSLNIF
jgi:hypothetical protein